MLGDLASRCPFCGGSDINRFFPVDHDAPDQTISVIECRHCEVAWQWPYNQQNSHTIVRLDYERIDGNAYFETDAARARAECELSFVTEHCPRPGRLLDVGAGVGSFIKLAAEAGWEAIGVEPRGEPFTMGHARLLRGQLSDVIQADDLFDVVTMFDVIEHVPDYYTLLKEASTHVKSGGVLVVETGNYQSLDRLRGGRSWWGYRTDHRWYLAPSVVKRQLGDLGFERIVLCDRLLRPHWNGRGQVAASLLETTRSIAKRPWKVVEIANSHRNERASAMKWPDWHHMGIFALAAIMPL